jgi:transcriptional regulator GlxA family with amidase domain
VTDRHVVFVVFDGFQPLDLTGPHEVFAGANSFLASSHRASPRYRLTVGAPSPGRVTSESGLGVHADALPSPADGPIDTIVVAGGLGAHRRRADDGLVAWLRDAAARARRTASVCTGAFLLAEAGLLDGRRATTHWARGERLAAAHPEVEVDIEPIHIRDGEVWTSAGVTAGIDLALAMVEEDHGPEAAQTIARWFVMFARRPGGQSQFATPVWADGAEREPIRAACALVHAHPETDLSVAAMAAHAGMSERNFTRAFARDVGRSPARYVEAVRVEAARRLLEQTSSAVAVVARHCGFGTAETMRRAFLRQLGVAPSDYRERFTTRERT